MITEKPAKQQNFQKEKLFLYYGNLRDRALISIFLIILEILGKDLPLYKQPIK
jgi:hypothetical protein